MVVNARSVTRKHSHFKFMRSGYLLCNVLHTDVILLMCLIDTTDI